MFSNANSSFWDLSRVFYKLMVFLVSAVSMNSRLVTVDAISVNRVDINVLQSLYDGASGDNWDWGLPLIAGPTWSFNHTNQADPCADTSLGSPEVWQGVECDKPPAVCSMPAANCTITILRLNSFSLAGTLPSDLGQLKSLEVLSLTENRGLRGRIPSELGQLSSLQRLLLDNNNLDGTIPSALGKLSQLEDLYILENDLTGSIPSELGGLSSLQWLWASFNSLNGTIPPELGKLMKLKVFVIERNFLQGTIPSELGTLSSLQTMYFDNNFLDGTIPPAFGQLKNLEVMVLEENYLRGGIPSELGALTSLQQLWLDDNDLDGTIPSELGQMRSLQILNLQLNRLRGSLPSELGALMSLELLDLNANYLDNTIPSELGQLKRLQYLSLQENCITGSIPSSLGFLSSLKEIWLTGNDISGTIPSELGQLGNLEYLILQDNRLHGSIPSSLGKLLSLQWLFLQNNFLDGTIPSELSSLSKLNMLDLSNCSFNGFISSTLGALRGLSSLELQHNNLWGEVPVSFANLSSLTLLRIDSNQLNGDLNSLFDAWAEGGSSILETVDLSNNLFSGSVPSSLFLLPNAVSIAVVGACFSGELPDTLCMPSKLEILALNGLSSAEGCDNLSWYEQLFGAMHGSIPQCVYSMPLLSSLSIVDNGFDGSIGALAKNSSLLSLQLSHNHLTGPIPNEYLRHSFSVLDISYNRISHTISELQVSDKPPLNRELILESNRLSGHLPDSIDSSNIDDLDILRGNLFACSKDSDRAGGDPFKDNASCGSSELNAALYFVVAVAVVVLTIFIALHNWNYCNSIFLSSLQKRVRGAVGLLGQLNGVQFGPSCLKRFILLGTILCGSCVFCSLLICVICIPLISLLKMGSGEGAFETHTFQYSYFMSFAMLSGNLPASLLVSVWVTVVLVLFWLLVYGEGVLYMLPNMMHNEKQLKGTLRSFIFIVGFLLINVVVSLGLNGAYVAALLSERSVLPNIVLQLFVAMFRVTWGKLMSTAIFHPSAEIMHQTKALILSVSFVFNNIVAPCLVVLFTDPSCFANLVVPADDTTSSYVYEQCTGFYSIYSNGQRFSICTSSGPVVTHVTYSPFFIYNFQCGSSLIRSFLPVVLSSYCITITISIVVICLANCDEGTIRKWTPERLLFLVPKIVRGSPSIVEGNASSTESLAIVERKNRLFRYQFDLALLVERLVMLFTFGLATPYVAFVCGLSAMMIWLRAVFTIFAYVDKRAAWDDASVIRRLNGSAEGIEYFSLLTVWKMVGFVSCLYIGLFALDISLDSSRASWGVALLFIVLPFSLCVVLCLIKIYMSRIGSEKNYKDDGAVLEPSLSESTPDRHTFEIQ